MLAKTPFVLRPRYTHENRDCVSQVDVLANDGARAPLLFTYVAKREWNVFRVRNPEWGCDVFAAYNAVRASIVKKMRAGEYKFSESSRSRARIQVGTGKAVKSLKAAQELCHPVKARTVKKLFKIKKKKPIRFVRVEAPWFVIKSDVNSCRIITSRPIVDEVALFLEKAGVPGRDLPRVVAQALDLRR